VPFTLVPVRKDEYPHWEDQHWADADVEGATRAMRDLVDDPGAGRTLGLQARAHLMTNFSYLTAGLRYMHRLAEDAAAAPSAGQAGALNTLAEAAHV
jgi:hypothetical protein